MGGTELMPNVEHVRSHYDRSNDFFRLWLDPTMTYSCAYFERDDATLEEAQVAKGAGQARAQAVNAVGLTLSQNQAAYCQQKFAEMDSPRSKQVRLQGWEQFDEPVDRIVSIGAFEHFADGVGTYERYDDFFTMCFRVLPDDGVMLLHSIVVPTAQEAERQGLKRTMSLLRFISFIRKEIYPGGRLPMISVVDEHATRAGFAITRHHRIGSHYVRTLDAWATALKEHQDEAIELKGEHTYETLMKYVTGCRELFRDGYTDVCQFTMDKRRRN